MHLPITVPVFMHLSSSGGRGAGADRSSRTVAAPAFANMAALEFSIGRYLCSALKCSWMAAHEFANGGPRAQLRCSWTAAAPTFVDGGAGVREMEVPVLSTEVRSQRTQDLCAGSRAGHPNVQASAARTTAQAFALPATSQREIGEAALVT